MKTFLLAAFLFTSVFSIAIAAPTANAAFVSADTLPQGTIAPEGTIPYVITVAGAKVDKIDLPKLQANLTLNSSSTSVQGDTEKFIFILTPSKPNFYHDPYSGTPYDFYRFPAFDIKTTDGQILHVNGIVFRINPNIFHFRAVQP